MMNLLLRLLPQATIDRLGYGTGDFKSLTDAYAAQRQAKTAEAPRDMDKIKSAFNSLKDMHKTPEWTQTGPMPQGPGFSPVQTAMAPPAAKPFDFESAQWPQGPIGAPQAPAAPAQAQAAPSEPALSAFMRNAALQRDHMTGEYLDPSAAAKADPSVFKGLFA